MTSFKVLGVLPTVLAVVLALLMVAAPLIGLAIVLAGLNDSLDVDRAAEWGRWAFLAAGFLLVPVLFGWWEDQRGSRTFLVMTGGTCVFSLVTYALLRAQASVGTPLRDLTLVTLVVGIAGGVVLLLIVFASKTWQRRTPRSKRPDQTEEGAGYMIVRAYVLQTLLKRGVVKSDEIDVTDMVNMPLGSWHELDRKPRG